MIAKTGYCNVIGGAFFAPLIPNPSPLVYDKEWEKGALLAAISDGGDIGGLVMRDLEEGS